MSHSLAAQSGAFHAVRFYKNSESLARLIGEFLHEGLSGGQPAVVIATSEHRLAIERQLCERGLDVEQLRSCRGWFSLDAGELLDEFMINGMPDAHEFRATLKPVLAHASRGNGVVRAYGEMVDLLWRAGQTVAATRLETLWNDLTRQFAFSLICGYSMGNFYKDAAVEDICRHHTHILSDPDDDAHAPSG
jgi:hypothetical protein